MRLLANTGAVRRVRSGLFVLSAFGLLLALGFWLFHSPYFPVKSVKIEGNLKRLSVADLEQTAHQHIRGNILSADLNATREAFAQLPWVAQVQVRRLWPDTVQVHIREREPLARWVNNGVADGGLIDASGVAFDAPTDEVFPIFSGNANARALMAEEYRMFRAILEPTGLGISRMDYSERLSRSITLSNDVVLHLGRHDADVRLRRFVLLWHEVLSQRAKQVGLVDLRYKDGAAVHYTTSGSPNP